MTHLIQYCLLILLLPVGIIHCDETPPTTNPVQSITTERLDQMTSKEQFSGLVVIMASWCPPCRAELPILAKLFRKYQEHGIQILAVSLDDAPTAAQPLINRLKIPFPVYWVGPQAANKYQIVGIPTTMVYHRGKLMEKLPGGHPLKILEKKIQLLMAASI